MRISIILLLTLAALALIAISMAMTGCATTPESAALTREAAYVALSEYQRQHPAPAPVTPDK